MSKTLRFLLFFLLISSCSLDNKSGIWTNSDKVKTDEDLIVEELFQELNIGPQHRILDPFAGCGTTNLTCKLNKIPSVGIELNPTMHSILQTKLDWDVDLQELRKVIESFAIPKKITLKPPEFLDNERQFLPGILRNLCGIKQFIKGIKSDKVC